MSYCINPHCSKPNDAANANNRICRNCGTQLLLQERYRVLHKLGSGGFGDTYEVSDNGKIKVLKILTETHPKAIELFQQEAQVLSQLQSSGIPRVEQDGYFAITLAGSSVQLHCLVMEKIQGVDLQQWMVLNHYQPISQQKSLDWLRQLVIILDLVHAKQYFHRDIKPHNIMLRKSGKLVLIDFGAVRQVTTTILAGNCHTRIFSEGYSPPEQQNGYSMPQSDFFALGRTFVFLLTGKEPHDPSIYDPLTNKLHWRQYATHISPLLLDIVDCLMAPTASQRPQNTQIILQQLLKFEQALRHPLAQPHHTPPTQNTVAGSNSRLSRVPTSVVGKPSSLPKNPQKNQRRIILFGLGIGGITVSVALGSLFANNKQITNPVVVKIPQDIASPATTPIATPTPLTESITNDSRSSTSNITSTPSFNNDALNPDSVNISTEIPSEQAPISEASSSSTPVLDKPTPTPDTSVTSVVQPKNSSLTAAQTSRPTVEEKLVTSPTPQPTLQHTNTHQHKAQATPNTNKGQQLPISAVAVLPNGTSIQLEVAKTAKQHERGLSYRPALPNNRGMLFDFPSAQTVNFWMKNVPVSLDMVFIHKGVVEYITASAPPCLKEHCPTYSPNTLINQVLLLRAGRTTELQLKVGDQIKIQSLNYAFQAKAKAKDSNNRQPAAVRTVKPRLTPSNKSETAAKLKKGRKPPPLLQLPTSNSGGVDAAQPWESKAPIKSASDELEDVIRGEIND